MNRPSPSQAFTLIEMLVVMAIIAILAGLVLSINGLVQRKAATSRAEAEIQALSAACESYKADNGIYPRDATTDALDAKSAAGGVPTGATFLAGSLYLYKALSGDTNANGTLEATEGKLYAMDFFKPNRLGGTKDSAGKITAVTYIMDPFGYSYGYSTAYQADPTKGYNPTFDLWSTTGKTISPTADTTITNVWIKNW